MASNDLWDVAGKKATWSLEMNSLWAKEAITNGDVIRLVTNVEQMEASLIGPRFYRGITVYGRELDEFLAAGYRRLGDYLVPPR